jgi:glutathione S-transferase
MHTQAAQLPVTGYHKLQAWFARVQALDAWKQAARGVDNGADDCG